ncbi:hypothetical protein WN55_09989 [Dufourea novaeangliae]|uniref:Uncharacterized protein n=1 Tax=Dufourea novaeangliae TaxID=178035 RepID=A0A154P866_DUFNO|nr:hypothetical protein WN55_09989 [Dufourea novaeangliae]
MSTIYLKCYEAVFFVDHANEPKLPFRKAAKALKKSSVFVQKHLYEHVVENFAKRMAICKRSQGGHLSDILFHVKPPSTLY